MVLLATIGTNEISTDAFSKHFFSLLNVPFEERESSHYIDGGYFKGIYNDVTFMVYSSDSTDTVNMPTEMPLIISVKGKDQTAINSAIEFIIRLNLIPEGYKFLEYKSDGNWIDFS